MSSVSSFEVIDSTAYCSSESNTVVPIRPSLVVDDIEDLVALKDMEPVHLMEPASQSASPVFLDQDPDFFIEDELSVFRVENCLFKVHRFFLDRESANFPRGVGSTAQPIDLDGVTRFEFKSLMNFFYHGMHNSTTPSLPQWIALLSISTRFDMAKVRQRAISEITVLRGDIDPVDQVVLAQKYHVPIWLSDAYFSLCARERPLAANEARKMEGDVPYLVAEAREGALKAQMNAYRSECSPKPFGTSDVPPCSLNDEARRTEIVRKVVDEVFGREEREKEAQRLAVEQEIARKEAERLQKELYEREKEKQRKLKEAKEAKERAEEEIMRMESGDDYPAPTPSFVRRKPSGSRAKGRKMISSPAEMAFE
ncbi:hypothetical protein HWV62_18828 [Athelia sp. TMB]|nr:hypothetical protein HWV62_18828 [Athelia sp. TMB]